LARHSVDIDQLKRERVGLYFVPVGAPPDVPAHIISDVVWGEESAGGTVDIELWMYCRGDNPEYQYVMQRDAPLDRPICRTCRRKHGYHLVDQANP
jgi:hypothetical protein